MELSTDSKPLILLNTHVYPRHRGDHVAPFMHDFAKTCTEFARVVVHCPHAEGLAESEIIDNVEIRRFRYAADAKETLAYRGDMHKQVLGSPKRLLFFLKFLRRWRKATQKLVNEIKPDIIHAHWLIPGGYVTMKAVSKKQPIHLSMHGTDVFLIRKRKIAQTLAKKVLKRTSAAHFVSNALREIIAESCSRPPIESDLLLPMVFGLDDFIDSRGSTEKLAEKGGGFLFVGRLLEVKGVDILLRAYSEIHAENSSDWCLDIVGDGPERTALESLADDLKLGDSVRFHGSLERGALREMYHDAKTLILPSRTTESGEQEGLGVVLLEAMSAAIPVIGSECGGIPEIIEDGVNGILVPQNDIDSLSQSMKRLQEDNVLRNRLVAGANRLMESCYSNDGMKNSIHEWYVGENGS